MIRKLSYAAALFGLALLTACDIDSPEYTADYLLPLVKTQVGVEDVDEIGEQEYRFVVRMPDVSHIITPSLPVPAISGESIGPLPLEDDSDAFIRAKLDTAEFELTVVNHFPINIKQGTKVVISNQNDGNIIFTHTLTEPVPAYGGSSTFRITLNSTTPWIYNDLNITLENYGTDGSNGQVVSFAAPNNSIELIFKIDVVRINEIELEPGKNYVIHDTIPVTIGGDDNTGNMEKGKLTLYLKNGFPGDFQFKGTFIDENYQVVDDQLSSAVISTPAVTVPDGYVVESTIIEDKIVTVHTRESIQNLENRTRYMRILGTFAVPTPAGVPIIRVKSKDNVKLQLVGDISIAVAP